MTDTKEMRAELLDEDGENRAVRSFLMQYSCDRALTVGAMLVHMNRSGWRGTAPAFALKVRPEEHLTKAGAQIWIRHLFSLEAALTCKPAGQVAGASPIAEVVAGNYGNRLLWHSEESQVVTPVGTQLYTRPAPEPVSVPVKWEDRAPLCPSDTEMVREIEAELADWRALAAERGWVK